MRQLTGAEMHDVYEVAERVNELVAGYDYLLSVVQAAEPHALADVAALRAENERLRAENKRLLSVNTRMVVDDIEFAKEREALRARVAELEPAAANWALVEAMPAGARFERALAGQGSPWQAGHKGGNMLGRETPDAALRAAFGKGEGE